MEMSIFRLYSGSDGQSHLEELSFSFMPGDIAEQSPTQAASGISFSRIKPGAFSDWHNAPRRQYVITLAGAIEIGLGDGSVHRLGPGDGILAEDLTGKGHTTRAVGNDTRVVVIPLAA
jgi:quercetin dioxygenase-like cupin family protein